MPVSLQKNSTEWTLDLSGVVDIDEVGQLLDRAREAAVGAPHVVVVRLAALESLDTAVTQVLLALQQSLAGGRVVRIEGVPAAVAELWRGAGLGDRLG
jgi:anti-anti-sigma regulatory factor